jgi:hypothetical protein
VCDTAAEFEASLDELCVSLGLQATKMFTVARERCAELAELKRAALAIEARQIVRMAALKKVTAVIVDNKRAAEPPAAAPPASRRRMLVVASPPKAPFIRRRSVTLVETSLALAAARGADSIAFRGLRASLIALLLSVGGGAKAMLARIAVGLPAERVGGNILHLSVLLNDVVTTTLLLEAGADVNLVDNAMSTALHVAVHIGAEDIVQVCS